MSNSSEDERAFVADIRQFVGEHLTDTMRRKSLAERPLSRGEADAWQRALFARGWAAPAWPQEYGGTGWSLERQHLFKREMGRSLAPSGPMFGLQMVGPVIYTFGLPEQKQRHLPGILTNDVWWCQGFSEPGAGSDLAAISTSAVRDGDHYVVNGQKIWTSYAHMADMIFLLARTSSGTKKQEGISFFVFDMRTPGVEVRPIVSMNGSHSLNEVFFNEVVIPRNSLIGEEGKGWTYAKFLLGNERLGIANLPRLWQRFEQLRTLSATPNFDGVTWRDNAPFQQELAALHANLRALEAFEAEAIQRISAGSSGGADMSILKVSGTELLQRADRLLFEISGQSGAIYFTGQEATEDPTGWKALTGRMLHGRAASVYGGTNEIQRDIIARSALDGRATALAGPFSEDDIQLQAAVDRFVQKNPASGSQRAGERDLTVSQRWRELGDLGWLASPLPEDVGGLGGTSVQTAIISEGLGRSLIVHSFHETAVYAGAVLASARSPLVERLVSGQTIVAAVFDGAPLGNGLAPISAQLVDGRTILRGYRPRVLSADRASHLLVVAKNAVDGETLLVLLDAHQPGVQAQPLLLLDGRTTADLRLIDVAVGSNEIIARGAAVEPTLDWARDYATLTTAAEAVGCMGGALDLVREHLQLRRQFGAAIGSNQAVRHRFADMFARFEQARAAVFLLARRLPELPSATRRLEASLVKAFVCEASRFLGEQAVQLHGGMGITDEHVVGRYYKRLLVLETMFGDRAGSLSTASAAQAPA